MLEALDDKIEALSLKRNTNANTPPTILHIIDTSPPTTRHSYPLTTVIQELVRSWSDGFVEMAVSGDVSAMTLTAQMYLSQRGYGNIQYNRVRGIQWLTSAAEHGDPDARSMLKRVDEKEYERLMERELGRKVTQADRAKDEDDIQAGKSEVENVRTVND